MAEGLFSKTLVADGWFDKTAQADGWFDDAQLQNPEPPPSTTITISNNTGATYSGFIASRIKENSANTNYSADVEIELTSFGVGDRTFTLAQINGLSNVTTGGIVSNARIRINATNLSNSNLKFEAIQCLRAVVQTQVTWNVYSSGNSWATAGGLNTTSDIGLVDLANLTIPSTTTNAYYELTGAGLTQWVQDVIDGVITNPDLMMRPDPQNAYNGTFAGFVSENGTDGRRPELVFDYTAGTTTVDLTLSTLGFSSKTNQNRSNAISTARQFSWSVKQLQNTSRTTHTAGVFDWTAQAVQNRQTVTPTSAILNWSAKVVTFASNVGLVIVDLLASTFSWSAKSVQNLVRTSHTATTLNWSAKAIQNRLTAIMNVTSFGFSAKSLQNRLTASLTATQLKWQGLPISPTRIIALSAALWASWSAKVVQNRIIVALTRALLNLQSLQITYVSDAIVAVVKRFKSRLSRYRQLLIQRRY